MYFLFPELAEVVVFRAQNRKKRAILSSAAIEPFEDDGCAWTPACKKARCGIVVSLSSMSRVPVMKRVGCIPRRSAKIGESIGLLTSS
jgi:hypothetical protein